MYLLEFNGQLTVWPRSSDQAVCKSQTLFCRCQQLLLSSSTFQSLLFALLLRISSTCSVHRSSKTWREGIYRFPDFVLYGALLLGFSLLISSYSGSFKLHPLTLKQYSWSSTPAWILAILRTLECVLKRSDTDVYITQLSSLSFKSSSPFSLLAFGCSPVPLNDWFLYFIQSLKLSPQGG